MDIGGKSNKVKQSGQPAGVPAHGIDRGGSRVAGPDQFVLDLHARLVELLPDATARAALLRVPLNVDSAWLEGRMLPVLRAQRKALIAQVARLERDAADFRS